MTPRLRRPRRRWLIAAAWTVAGAVVLLTAGEIVARLAIGSRVELSVQSLELPEGVQLGLARDLILPSLASGTLHLDATISSAGVEALAACLPAAEDAQVSIEGGEIVARKHVTVRGAELPVSVTLRPVLVAGALVLEPGEVTVADMQLPGALAARLASRSQAGALFSGGIPLGDRLPDGVAVLAVEVADDAMSVTLAVPVSVAREALADGRGSPDVRGCDA